MFNSVVRLTGLCDEKQLKALTDEILAELRRREEELAASERKGVFIYRVILIHVFAHLEASGNVQRIEFLRKILPIHPSHYSRLTEK